MKILFLGFNDYTRTSSALYHIRFALEKITDMVHYGEGFPSWTEYKEIRDVPTLEKIYKPDIILLQGFPLKADSWWKNLDKTSVPKAKFFSNPHEQPKRRAHTVNQDKIVMSLHHIKGWMDRYKPLFAPNHKMRWIPFCINPDVFKDYGFERIYDVATLGAMARGYYPVRAMIRDTLLKRKYLKVFNRGRPQAYGDPNKIFMRANYAKAIARCKMMIFHTGSHQYAVQKFYEGMGCKTLTLANTPLDAKDLHFKSGYNFVEINEKNFVNKIHYYLKHEGERNRIVNNGYDTVMKYHTCAIRAKQILGYLEELV